MSNKFIASCWSGHDSSFAILDEKNGEIVSHVELERHIREKEVKADSIDWMLKMFDKCENITLLAVPTPISLINGESFKKLSKKTKSVGNNLAIIPVGHHDCHAANAFYTSEFDDALVVTVDGGGVELNDLETATTGWYGNGIKLDNLMKLSMKINIGGLWTRVTRYIFKLQSGWPYGHQAGSVMAMAALGKNPDMFLNDFKTMLGPHLLISSHRPKDQKPGPSIPNLDPVHPYLDKWRKIAETDDELKYNMAASLQKATEEQLFDIIDMFLDACESKHGTRPKNLCLSGGVALNSVAVGKMYDHFGFENIHIPATPHDGGLSIGAAQYVHHTINLNERNKSFHSPYLGVEYSYDDFTSDLDDVIEEVDEKCMIKVNVDEDEVIDLLDKQDIVAVFNGRAESGRRALGNRSILADPRSPMMKSKINEKVKHRQWYRPFAPSIMEEEVKNWFERDIKSPYMSHVLKFKKEKAQLVPAVVHIDGTARLQTVSEQTNEWYYNLLKKWKERSGVPILLNTSFNDREPVTERPKHALKCFLGTDIDHVYFVEHKILISKKS